MEAVPPKRPPAINHKLSTFLRECRFLVLVFFGKRHGQTNSDHGLLAISREHDLEQYGNPPINRSQQMEQPVAYDWVC